MEIYRFTDIENGLYCFNNNVFASYFGDIANKKDNNR